MQQLESISQAIKHIYWTLALLGLALILLAILIALFPAVLFVLVVIMLLVLGIALLVLAAKIRNLWQKLPGFLKK